MATVWLHGVDLEGEFIGCQVASLPGVLDRAETLLTKVSIPGMAGAYSAGPITVPVREFSVGLTMSDEDTASVRTMLRDILSLVGPNTITVRIADRADLLIYARLKRAKAQPDFPSLVSDGLDAVLEFEADVPYWRELSAQTYRVDTSLTTLPMGNAPTAPTWELFSADGGSVVNPWLKIYDATGTLNRTSTFTLTLAGEDVLQVITGADEMAVILSDAGVIAQNDALLTGGLFPGSLDPHALGNPYLGHLPMAQVGADSGTVQARAIFPRQYL